MTPACLALGEGLADSCRRREQHLLRGKRLHARPGVPPSPRAGGKQAHLSEDLPQLKSQPPLKGVQKIAVL